MESRFAGSRLVCWILACLTLTPLILAAGCGGSRLDTVPVSGKVTYRGNPLPWGMVKFQPVERTSRPGVADIQADGTYSVGTLANALGLVRGEYRVTVYADKTPLFTPSPEQKAAAAKISLPTSRRYTHPKTSGLTLTIGPDDSTKTYDIDLKE